MAIIINIIIITNFRSVQVFYDVISVFGSSHGKNTMAFLDTVDRHPDNFTLLD